MKLGSVYFSVLAIASLFAAFSVLGCASAPESSPPPSEENVVPGNEKSVAEYYKELEDEYWSGKTVRIYSKASGILLIKGVEKGRIEIDQRVTFPARELFSEGAWSITVIADTGIPMDTEIYKRPYEEPTESRSYAPMSVRGVGGDDRDSDRITNKSTAESKWNNFLSAHREEILPEITFIHVDTARIEKDAWAHGITNQDVKIITGTNGEFMTLAVGEPPSQKPSSQNQHRIIGK